MGMLLQRCRRYNPVFTLFILVSVSVLIQVPTEKAVFGNTHKPTNLRNTPDSRLAQRLTIVNDFYWSEIYGTNDMDLCAALAECDDGGYAMVGTTTYQSIWGYVGGILVVRTNSEGTLQWIERIEFHGDLTDDTGVAIRARSNGGIAVLGTREHGTMWIETCLIGFDASGNMNLLRHYGEQYDRYIARDLAVCSDGGYAIIGNTYEYSFSVVLIIRIDASGNTLWTNTSESGVGHAITECSSGGFAILSRFGDNIVLLRTNSLGEVQWRKTYEGTGSSFELVECSDGGFAFVGDGVLRRVNQEGVLLWTQTFPVDPSHMDVCPDQGFILLGNIDNGGTDYDQWVGRTDNNGVLLWSKIYGSPGRDSGAGIVKCTGEGFAVAGSTVEGEPDSHNVWLHRIPDGTPSNTTPSPLDSPIFPIVIIVVVPILIVVLVLAYLWYRKRASQKR